MTAIFTSTAQIMLDICVNHV